MTLPVLEKTWEFDVNRWYQHTDTSDEVSAREMLGTLKNQLTGASHTGYQGTITEISAGVTYQLVCSDRGGDPTRAGSEDFTADLVGKYVEFVGASSGGNNGVFEITDVPGVDTIQYACTTGVAEAFIGSIRVSNGQFTSGAGSTPATEILTFTGNASAGEAVVIAARTYTFEVAIAGASGDTVLIGASASDSLDNLIACINRDAGGGTLYSGVTRDNFDVSAAAGAGDTMDVTARPRGVRGDTIGVSTSVAGASWGGANLSGGVDGHFPAWRCKGSHGTSKGALMDGIDRWQDVVSDIASNTSGTRGWFVWVNDVTGAELMWWGDTHSTSYQWERTWIYVSPELGFTGGTTSAAPSAADQVALSSDSTEWMGSTACADQTWIFHMMHSDDGHDTRFFGQSWNVTYFQFISEVAKDATKDGALIPWNGFQNVMDWTHSSGEMMTIAVFNDNAQMRATFDKDSSAGGPYLAGMYMSSEHYIAATLAQNFATVRDEMANEFLITPMGLTASTVGYRGRHGRLSDMWYVATGTNTGIPMGSTLPGDGSHQFVKLSQFIYPWAGVPMRTR